MSIPRPTGQYKIKMTVPPQAWPEIDEDAHGLRANELLKTGLQLDAAGASWLQILTFIFDGNTWAGQASDAGRMRMQNVSEINVSVGTMLRDAISFHLHAYESIVNAKKHIAANCDAAQKVIDRLTSMPLSSKNDQQKRDDAIEAIVDKAFKANSAVVNAASIAITAGQIYPPVKDKDIPEFGANVPDFGGAQGGFGAPSGAGAAPRGGGDVKAAALGKADSKSADAEKRDREGVQAAGSGAGGAGPSPASRDRETPQAAGVGADPPGVIQNVGHNAARSSSEPPSSANARPMSPNSSSAPGPSSASGAGGASPVGSAASSPASNSQPSPAKPYSTSDYQQLKPDADLKSAQGKGGEKAPTDQFARGAASAATQQPTLAPASATTPPQTPVAQPTDAAAAPVQHAAGSIGGGAGGGGGGGGGAMSGSTGPFGSPSTSSPMPPPMPLGPPATPPPAGPPPTSAASQPAASTNTGPGVNPASTGRTDPTVAGMAPMPVSPARLERDAMLSASTAGAMQRQRGNGSAALIHARRIAAALNMGPAQYGFFWVTGLATDGSIVVANSFGLGYIPDGVELPPQVTLGSADESIAPGERAKWATYPILAIQGWAAAHGLSLRAVIATKEQFASFDPGVPKVVLQRDDIPETGKMQGRSRLEVIAPSAAARLASVGDGALQDLLPVAPADSTPPEDRSAALWFGLTKPLMSTSSDRGLVHLEAFVEYADHVHELALHKAHNALDATVQRAAIADWVYWQHLSVLMSDGINAETTV